jgi:hypothetical protein
MHCAALAPMNMAWAPPRATALKRWMHCVVLLGLWLLLAVAAAPGYAQPVAVVTDGGSVGRVFAASGSRKVETLELLNAGTRVQVDAVAPFVVLFLASGVEFSFTGPGVVEVGHGQLVALAGNPPQMRPPTPGKEIRLRTQRTAQGGVVLRSVAAEPLPAAAGGAPAAEARRPAADAPLASWVAYALWLDEHQAGEEAKAVWRRVAAERPQDPVLAQRAQ